MTASGPLYNVQKTIAHLFEHQAERFRHRVLFYFQSGNRWVGRTWREARDRVLRLAAGLEEAGVAHGDRVAIIAETSPDWTAVDQAILRLGGVTVGIYPTSTVEQVAYILTHSESRVLFVENAAQWKRIEGILESCPDLRRLVLIRPDRALLSESPRGLQSLKALEEQGELALASDASFAARTLERVKPDDVATLVYTSGTTGPPKGVVLTHRNLFEISDVANRWLGSQPTDVGVVFLPMAHSLQRVASYGGLRSGATGYYAPSLDRLPETWLAAQPTVVSSVPRIFEKIHAKINAGLAEAPPRRQQLFKLALGVGYRHSEYLQRRQTPPIVLRAAYALFDRLVFSKIRARTFGERVRFLISGGAPIGLELLRFFHAIGLLILEGYGLTETSAPATLNQEQWFKFGTVGRALPGVGVKIADDGEILINGPGVFRAYYKDEAATREAFDDEGWFRSGDIGTIDEDGFVRITDRKKDLIITAGGKNIAPQNIENLLKAEPLVSQAMVYGDREKYLVVLLTLDAEALAAWAEAQGKSARVAAELVGDRDLERDIEAALGRVNGQLARYESIKTFRIVAEDFSVENDMLTPSLKLKRRVISERYRPLIREMYDQ
ncbi:MAG: long-chain fatty acid--CoA ligase [Myxococcales bacterium]|nr:long-chain fatty acid--CoA ligase [Myxococcales bacterium]